MRHIPFLQALAEVSSTDDPVWRDASAGYLVLRFFDRWLEEGPARVSADTGLEGLRARIRSVPDVAPQVRDTLLKAIQEMVDAEEANPAVVSESLLGYGKYLELTGRLQLAAHVYQTLIEVLDPPSGGNNPIAAAMAHMQYGFVVRQSGDFDAARNSYQRAQVLAEQEGDVPIVFRAQFGIANTLRARGNLGDAETLLDRLVRDAVDIGLNDAEARALHSRAGIRQMRKRYDEAMIDFFRAYELTDDITDQEAILGDLAACAAEAGYRAMAWNTHRLLAYTARSPVVRSASLVNLLELAVLDGRAAEFERIRIQIQTHSDSNTMPMEHKIHAALYTATGVERFDTREAAITAYRTVAEEAKRAGVHQIMFIAEEHLGALLTDTVTQNEQPVLDPPPLLRHVVDTIAELSTLAVSPV